MNLSKEHFDMYNEYTLNINKIKREVNAIIKRQRFTARRCKRASEEEILDIEINKYEEVESINKKKIPKEENEKFKIVLTQKETEELLKKTDIILPKKRKYYIENLYSHYEHTMYIEPLDETRRIIEEKCPEYLGEFDKLHKRTSAHMFNMFIMKKEILDEYCTWLFDILFELEKRTDASKYDSFHARFYGRISELLLDVWVNRNKIKYEEVKVMDMQNVNWLKKGTSFLNAKFTGKKYGKSF